jgi:predicted deacylase
MQLRHKSLILLGFLTLLFVSCSSKYYVRNTFEYPTPVETSNKKIQLQIKKTYHIDDVYADNLFDGARMNAFTKINDSLFEIIINPENFPINDSSWFAFRIHSDSAKTVYLKLTYNNGHHRYIPKISKDRIHWQSIDKENIIISKDETSVIFPVQLDHAMTWISAQEIINSSDVNSWINTLKNKKNTSDFKSIGKSKLDRNIPYFRIGEGSPKGKKVIILMSRQHPPEITGYLAFQHFVEELTTSHKLSSDFYKKYDIWVFPLLNPDGVDLGHWRHNANGIDLNRDWAYYRQPETDAVTKFIVKNAKQYKNKIILGLDFHSTQNDVYYVFDETFKSNLPNFQKYWTESIDRLVFPFKSKYSPEGLSKPFSKIWFYKQFNAESMTYEVGDEVSRDLIEKKARIAAITMMDLLIKY